MVVAPAAQGRYFFPAAPTLILLAAAGLNVWRRWRINTLIVVGLALLSLLTPRWLIAPAYTPPPPVATLPAELTPVMVPFGEGMTLVAMESLQASVLPSAIVTVTAAWRADAQPSRDLSVFVHLVDNDGLIAAQVDTMPGGGLSPTSQWRPGELRVDTYRLRIPPTAYTPNEGRIAIGLYDALVDEQPRQPILAGADPGPGVIHDQALYLGRVTITPPIGQVPNQMAVDFEDNITLAGYRFSQRRFHPGDTLTVTLYWRARDIISKEYTTFVHLLDTNFAMFGGHDGTPAIATSEWEPATILEDAHVFTVLPETPPGSYQIELGLYDSELDRLPLLDTQGAEGADRLLLGPLEVVTE
jgi:hypothetical protein